MLTESISYTYLLKSIILLLSSTDSKAGLSFNPSITLKYRPLLGRGFSHCLPALNPFCLRLSATVLVDMRFLS
ncbi:hypothetical protein FXW30_05445 [Candidatus Liberibacter asiaticus]|nr:hypothetical protein FXW32_05455 [Candidatus Liberibacter asiaticus]KAE9520189.1 hypothetical protein FXW30_05445 [Candidatus Liberibacter asiaticus]